MIELILFIALGLLILILFEIRARKQKKNNTIQQDRLPNESPSTDGECCGQHLVCERETLLQSNAEIEYFDDEELDAFAFIEPDNYTQQQHDAIRAVFDTLYHFR